jgi:hypothetical protein
MVPGVFADQGVKHLFRLVVYAAIDQLEGVIDSFLNLRFYFDDKTAGIGRLLLRLLILLRLSIVAALARRIAQCHTTNGTDRGVVPDHAEPLPLSAFAVMAILFR